MRKRFQVFVLILLVAVLPACSVISEKEKERADITAALQKYLSERSGLNLANMDWKITNLNTDRDTAAVQVTFTAKQGDATMVMEYQMKKVNGVWTVQKSGPRGGVGAPVHPGADAAPSMPPAGSGSGALPSGHPPVTAQPPAPAKAQPTPKKSS